ncbi:hypothetical protein SISSUDRAFT_1052948, partial [Sistotremastrum suecicum HHB10207 ss-3]
MPRYDHDILLASHGRLAHPSKMRILGDSDALPIYQRYKFNDIFILISYLPTLSCFLQSLIACAISVGTIILLENIQMIECSSTFRNLPRCRPVSFTNAV